MYQAVVQQVVMPADGNPVEVLRTEDGTLVVSVRSICRGIGVDHKSQRDKIKSDSKYRWGDITSPSAGGPQQMFCIPLDQLNGWLFSINANKVSEHVRPNLIAYQQECFKVLYQHFMPRGEVDLQPFMDKLCSIHDELKHIRGATDAVFGDDKEEIQSLVEQVAVVHRVDGRTVWGWIQTELDVQSYKKQNRKIINFLRNKLGKGLTLVPHQQP